MSERLTILLIDDDRADRLVLRAHLRNTSFDSEVIESDCVTNALSRLRCNPDCVIVDYRLSGETGLDLLAAIRANEEQQPDRDGLPVIVLTGRGDEAMAVAAMKAGATDYVPKAELTPDRLESSIRSGIEIHHQRGVARRAQVALQRANNELEQRVRDRTAELEDANASLARRNAELDEFTYVASHDLQEPLRKLIAFADLLPRDLDGIALSERAQDDLRFIAEAAQRMQSLVRGLLALSRASKGEVGREPVALDDCVNSAIEALSLRIQDTHAVIQRNALPKVHGDSLLLTQLYQNLIGNSLKYTQPGQAPAITLTAVCSDAGWTMGVRDHGIGLKPQYAEQIFAPFKRLHGRDEYEGSGMGLAICRKIVERHKGRIWVESELNQGAHFRFTVGNEKESDACPSLHENTPLSCSPMTTQEIRS